MLYYNLSFHLLIVGICGIMPPLEQAATLQAIRPLVYLLVPTRSKTLNLTDIEGET